MVFIVFSKSMNVTECVCTCLNITNEIYSNCICTCSGEEFNEAKYIAKEVFGYITGILVTVKMLPQVIKVYKTKQTRHLSMKFLIIGVFGAISAFIYGGLLDLELAIMIRAAITFVLTWLLIGGKITFDKKDKELEKESETNDIEMVNLTDTNESIDNEIDNEVYSDTVVEVSEEEATV
jgi:MtN3 and saliva related transmembrane protein